MPVTEDLLKLEGLRSAAFPDSAVDLTVRRGEILGLAGLIGAGRTELARAVFGVDRPAGGRILLDGSEISVSAPTDAIRHGIYLVPEDRKQSGLILEDTIADNICLANLRAFTRSGLVRPALEEQCAREQSRALRIKAPSVATPSAASPAATSRRWCSPNGSP